MDTVIKPKALQKGDTVALVAPSEPVSKTQVVRVTHYFEKNGFKVKTGDNILKAIGEYIAGTPQERANDINWAFSDPEVKAILTMVGGLGASQLLDRLDFELIKKNPKILIGYSDATTLQLPILAKTGMVTFHGPNAAALPDLRPYGYTMSNFWKVISQPQPDGIITPQSVWQSIRDGNTQGTLFGGNVSCLSRLLGTKWDPIAALPKIFGEDTKYLFFWEEVYEEFSEIMRGLWQIRNSGFFENVSGMVIGKLTAVAEKEYHNFPSKKDLIKELTEPFGFPILYGVDFGHEVPKATIPIGVKAYMDSKNSKLEILESGVI